MSETVKILLKKPEEMQPTKDEFWLGVWGRGKYAVLDQMVDVDLDEMLAKYRGRETVHYGKSFTEYLKEQLEENHG